MQMQTSFPFRLPQANAVFLFCSNCLHALADGKQSKPVSAALYARMIPGCQICLADHPLYKISRRDNYATEFLGFDRRRTDAHKNS